MANASMRRNSALLALALLAACDVSTPEREQRAGEVSARVSDNVTVEAEDPAGVGAPPAWQVAGGLAAFGAAGQPPLLSIRCDRAEGAVVLERGGGGQGLTVAVGDYEQTLATDAGEGDKVRARVPLDDPLLARMAAPQARMFVVTAAGERVALPGGVAIRRVLDRCRNPAPAPTPEAENAVEPGNVVLPPMVVPVVQP